MGSNTCLGNWEGKCCGCGTCQSGESGRHGALGWCHERIHVCRPAANLRGPVLAAGPRDPDFGIERLRPAKKLLHFVGVCAERSVSHGLARNLSTRRPGNAEIEYESLRLGG